MRDLGEADHNPTIELSLDEFAASELACEARAQGTDVPAIVAEAVDEYLAAVEDDGDERPSLELPGFAEREPAGGEERVSVELPDVCQAALEQLAERRQQPIARLAEHAVLLYLSKRDPRDEHANPSRRGKGTRSAERKSNQRSGR